MLKCGDGCTGKFLILLLWPCGNRTAKFPLDEPRHVLFGRSLFDQKRFQFRATIPNSVCPGDRHSSRAQPLACCRKGNQSPFILLRAICKFLPEPEQKVAESTPMSPASRDFDEAASNGQKPGDNVFSPDSMLVACRELGTQ